MKVFLTDEVIYTFQNIQEINMQTKDLLIPGMLVSSMGIIVLLFFVVCQKKC